jgi:hypothetical protein
MNPANQFRITEGFVCFENIDNPSLDLGKSADYPLFATPRESCKNIDTQFRLIYSFKDSDFMKANNREILDLLPGLTKPNLP